MTLEYLLENIDHIVFREIDFVDKKIKYERYGSYFNFDDIDIMKKSMECLYWNKSSTMKLHIRRKLDVLIHVEDIEIEKIFNIASTKQPCIQVRHVGKSTIITNLTDILSDDIINYYSKQNIAKREARKERESKYPPGFKILDYYTVQCNLGHQCRRVDHIGTCRVCTIIDRRKIFFDKFLDIFKDYKLDMRERLDDFKSKKYDIHVIKIYIRHPKNNRIMAKVIFYDADGGEYIKSKTNKILHFHFSDEEIKNKNEEYIINNINRMLDTFIKFYKIGDKK